MQNILIVDDDTSYRDQMAEMFIDAGYSVTVTNSVANAICGVIRKVAQVVVLGGARCDEVATLDLVSIIKRCNSKMPIILIADMSLGLLRKLRCDGIFYHALKPVDPEGHEEVRQAVQCALKTYVPTPHD